MSSGGWMAIPSFWAPDGCCGAVTTSHVRVEILATLGVTDKRDAMAFCPAVLAFSNGAAGWTERSPW